MKLIDEMLKSCPCDECNKRMAYARTFGAYFYGDDCPYRCTAYERYKGQKGKTMSNELTDEIKMDAMRKPYQALMSVDVVPVVRCKDCIYAERARVNDKGFTICEASNMEITENDFCSYGERKDGERKDDGTTVD